MNLSIICAMGDDLSIGKNNKLLWNIPEDMSWFKEHTVGKNVVMGRKTFESIGKPLKGRINHVITTKKDYRADGVNIFNSTDEILAELNNEKEVMILGGSNVYSQTLPLIDRMYITRVHHEFSEADSYFPDVDWDEWKEYYFKELQTKKYNVTFHVYKRKHLTS